MNACCSLNSIVGGNCGFDRRDRKRDIRGSMHKPTGSHISSLGISGTVDEEELILSRAVIQLQNINSIPICLLRRHRSKFGLIWQILEKFIYV